MHGESIGEPQHFQGVWELSEAWVAVARTTLPSLSQMMCCKALLFPPLHTYTATSKVASLLSVSCVFVSVCVYVSVCVCVSVCVFSLFTALGRARHWGKLSSHLTHMTQKELALETGPSMLQGDHVRQIIAEMVKQMTIHGRQTEVGTGRIPVAVSERLFPEKD